jgi:hypothetical protein
MTGAPDRAESTVTGGFMPEPPQLDREAPLLAQPGWTS